MRNIFENIPKFIEREIFNELVTHKGGIRIERILSRGQTSLAEGWYDQDEQEWVMVIQGAGVIAFEDDSEVRLETGDFLNIPAHTKHRVKWTDPAETTIWLAVFYY